MIQRRLLSIALALLLIAIAARPARAVYTGDINVYFDDRQGKPAGGTFIAFGQPVDIKWEQSVEENWEKDKDPQITFGNGPYYQLGPPPPKILRAIFNQAFPAMLMGELAFVSWIAATGGLDFLAFLYALETRDPYCRYYNMMDDYYAGLLSRAEFNRLADRLEADYGRGPWTRPILYSRDEESSISSLFKTPRYLAGGLVTTIENTKYDRIRTLTEDDGRASWRDNSVTRGTLYYNQGAYSMPYDIPLHEGANNYNLSHYKFDRWVVGGNSLSLTSAYQYDGWKPTSYTKIGTNYGLSTGWTIGTGLDYKFGSDVTVEKDFSLDAYITPNDPLYGSSGTWKQSYADQWALKRIGFKPLEDPTSAWHSTTGTESPVVVAVLDSGIDLTHPDLNIANIWRNPKETPGNARDDDNNGFIDDLIGWYFVQNNNNPFDLAGHGTHVAGLIAARWNNGRGIAGINRGARIMPLKVLNEIGKGWGSDLARAVVYAVDNGAKIINISAGHEGHAKFLEKALAYAQEKNVLVVVAAGNTAIDAKGVEPANQPGALVVAATLPNDKPGGFSHYREMVHLAAPGVDVLSLRAQGTDVVRKVATDPSKNKPGESAGGKDRPYDRRSGTSFAAPLVTGVASLMLAKNPNLTAEQIKRMLMMSADDIEAPGWDQLTGYGLVNARQAIEADPDYYLYA